MKRYILFLCISCLSLAASAQQWLNDFKALNADIIDSVVVSKVDRGWQDYLRMDAYQIYYHQPLDHEVPDGEQFQLRATLVVRRGYDVSQQPVLVSLSGYNIHPYHWDYPSYYVGDAEKSNAFYEISTHLKSNVLSLEHRYFDGSFPADGNLRMEYCTAKQAAADFHSIIQALKKVCGGKYVISGISKGGTTTFMQHAFYPEDGDLYVSYVGPMCDTPDDSRVMAYYKKLAWTDELNERVNALQRTMLKNNEVYNYFRSWYRSYYPTMTDQTIKLNFLYFVGVMDYGMHMSNSRSEVKKMLDDVDAKKKQLMSQGYSEPYLLANMVYFGTLDAETSWGWLLKQANVTRTAGDFPQPDRAPILRLPVPFTISKSDYDPTMTAYYYQASTELGSFGYDFRAILDKEDESELADQLNATWKQCDNPIALTVSSMKGLTYSVELRDYVVSATMNATRPILFLFGGDDAWTGGALPDECYNGYNTRKIILPQQNHGACISKASLSDRTAIWHFIDDALAGAYTVDIEHVGANSSSTQQWYNLQGQRIHHPVHGIYIKNGKKVVK